MNSRIAVTPLPSGRPSIRSALRDGRVRTAMSAPNTSFPNSMARLIAVKWDRATGQGEGDKAHTRER